MSLITVDTSRCAKDGLCVAVCSFNLLRLNDDGYPEEIPTPGPCMACGHCVAVCPKEALTNHNLPDEALLPVYKDLPSSQAVDGMLLARRSVRYFKDQAIPQETLASVLDVARHAPTACNLQQLQWIVAPNAAKVRELAAEAVAWVRDVGVHMDGFSMMTKEEVEENLPIVLKFWEHGEDFILRGASALVMVCAPDYDWAREDCATALTFLELAAEARGLGVCWAGIFTRLAMVHAPLREILGIPEGYTLGGTLMLGVPKYRYRRVPPRKPLSVRWI